MNKQLFSLKRIISLGVTGSLIDVGGQSRAVLTPSGPLGPGALSLQKLSLMALYLQVSGVAGAFVRGGGRAGWGVITHAFEGESSGGA